MAYKTLTQTMENVGSKPNTADHRALEKKNKKLEMVLH